MQKIEKSCVKAVFFHDHVFKQCEERYFSEGKLTDKTWGRYFYFCHELKIVARVNKLPAFEKNNSLNETTDPRVSFSCFDRVTVLDRVFLLM